MDGLYGGLTKIWEGVKSMSAWRRWIRPDTGCEDLDM